MLYTITTDQVDFCVEGKCLCGWSIKVKATMVRAVSLGWPSSYMDFSAARWSVQRQHEIHMKSVGL